jgi:hypothetical protein
MRALTSLQEGRELPLEEAIREIDRIGGKMGAVKGSREKERLGGMLAEVSNLVF